MNFIKALMIFIRMYRDGFFFSANTHIDSDEGTKQRWGFYRFNHRKQFALFDIDFAFDKTMSGYFHIHGDDYRLEFGENGRVANIIKQISFTEREWKCLSN